MREHGTHARYVQGPNVDDAPGKGCRCELCRIANTLYERQRSRRKAPPYVSAEPAREHARLLAEQGVGLKSLARLSGVSTGSLSKLVYGNYARGTGPSPRIRRDTEQKILAVRADDGPGGTRVPAAPIWKVVDQLLERGWTKVGIARAIGQQGPGLQLGHTVVNRRNARAVRGLLERPVPERGTRYGPQTVAFDHELERREQARRAAEAERRAEQRAGEAQRAADLGLEEPPDPAERDPWRIDLAPLPEGVDTSWKSDGACRDPEVPGWIFFPDQSDSHLIAAARRVCARCDVRVECLRYALEVGEVGFWGGTTDRERRNEQAVA